MQSLNGTWWVPVISVVLIVGCLGLARLIDHLIACYWDRH